MNPLTRFLHSIGYAAVNDEMVIFIKGGRKQIRKKAGSKCVRKIVNANKHNV